MKYYLITFKHLQLHTEKNIKLISKERHSRHIYLSSEQQNYDIHVYTDRTVHVVYTHHMHVELPDKNTHTHTHKQNLKEKKAVKHF